MIGAELDKQFRRLKLGIILALMVGVPVLLAIVLKLGRRQDSQGGGTFIELSSRSGLNLAITSLAHIGPLVLPVVAAVVAGSAVAEEGGWRTLGYLLIRPVGRGRLLTAKLAVAAALILVAVLVATLASVAAGAAAFGWEPLTLRSGATLSAPAGLLRIGVAALYIAWSVASVAAVAFLVSALSTAPLNAAATGLAFYVISQVLDSFAAMGDARVVLPTHYWGAWQNLVAAAPGWHDVVAGAALQLPYVFLFLGLAWWGFRRRDIVT